MSESVWVPSPAAETVANIQKQAAGYCLHVDDDEAIERALMGIRRAIDRLNTRDWNWAVSYDDIFFIAGQTDYTLHPMFKTPMHLDIWNSDYTSSHRLGYKWPKRYLTEFPNGRPNAGSPCNYSCLNVHSFGSLSLDAAPTPEWVSQYPNGRIWYYRNILYPGSSSGSLDVPAKVSAFIQYWADGYTADTYAVAKAQAAYQRAEEQLRELIKDDNNLQPDWDD